MNRSLPWAVVLCSAALVLTPQLLTRLHAAPTSYSESVSGDLPDESPLPVFTLDIGVNTVSGTCGFTGVNDYDSFAFIVPASHQVTSGQVVMTDASGEFISSAWGLYSGSVEPLTGTSLGSINSPSPGFGNFPATPLGPDSYNVTHGTFTTQGPSGTANYTFSITVIPEPASLCLLTLAGPMLFRRRRG